GDPPQGVAVVRIDLQCAVEQWPRAGAALARHLRESESRNYRRIVRQYFEPRLKLGRRFIPEAALNQSETVSDSGFHIVRFHANHVPVISEFIPPDVVVCNAEKERDRQESPTNQCAITKWNRCKRDRAGK